MNDAHDRCFWITVKQAPKNVERRVFVAMCDGAWFSGDPTDCTCDSWPNRLEAQQATIAGLRQRAAAAEEALERNRKRAGAERRRLVLWQQRERDRLAREWAAIREAVRELGGAVGDRLAEDLERRRRLVATRSETTP